MQMRSPIAVLDLFPLIYVFFSQNDLVYVNLCFDKRPVPDRTFCLLYFMDLGMGMATPDGRMGMGIRIEVVSRLPL